MLQEKLYERAAGNINQIFYNPIARVIKKEFGTINNLLEIKCGTGNILKYLRQISPKSKLSGINLSQFMINMAEQNLQNKKISLYCTKLNPTPFGEKSFSEIIAVNLFYSKLEYKDLFFEIKRLLKPGKSALIFDWDKNAHIEDLEYITRTWSANFPPLVRFFAYRKLVGDFKLHAFSLNDIAEFVESLKIFRWEVKPYSILGREVFWMLKITI